MVNPNSNTTSANTDNNIVQVTTQGGNIVNVTQPVTNIIEVATLGPKGDSGDGFPFISNSSNNGIAQVTGSMDISENLQVNGSEVDFNNLPTSDPNISGRLFQTSSNVIGAPHAFKVVCISQG
jgi:hypothetical protein